MKAADYPFTVNKESSMTYGDLVQRCPGLSRTTENHVWDNMTISEQRDWAVQQAEILLDMSLCDRQTERLLNARLETWQAAVVKHHSQKADDRCTSDDTELYAAFGLPPADHCVGDRFAMAQNCLRFIERRCEGGKWPIYVELEARIAELETQLADKAEVLAREDGKLAGIVEQSYAEWQRDVRSAAAED